MEFSGQEKIFPVDGQHRVEGIRAALLEKEDLGSETISVMLIGHQNTAEGREKSRRIFSTLNRYVKPVRLGDIIALDEPTSHLDIGSQATIFKLLKMLNEKYNKTIITTVHDLNLAGEFCSDIVFLDNKKVINFGSAEKVLNYSDIEKVYNVKVVVKTNPVSNKPIVVPIYN